MKRRRGVSLIESLVLMSALATIVSLSAVLIVRVQRLSAAASRVHDSERVAWRLAADLRRAVHAAASATIEADDQSATLTLGLPSGGAESWRFDATGVTLERGGETASGEAYPFPSKPLWDVNLTDDGSTLRVASRSAGEVATARLGRAEFALVARLLNAADGEETP